MKKINVAGLLKQFLEEDIGRGDITSSLLQRKKITAKIVSREKGIVAGTNYTKKIFGLKNSKVTIKKRDGSLVFPNQVVMTISGDAKNILSCERTALNLLARMSGIATLTKNLTKKISKYNVKLYATRKTAPGLRIFDKEAVKIGGGEKHRMRLDEMIMIKDNHIAVSGSSISELVKKAKKRGRKVEVEVENQKDAIVAAKSGATIIMLDNFLPSQIAKTIQKLKTADLRKKIKIEASGGINEKNIAKYAKSGVDIISLGLLTHSVKSLDFSLEVS